MPCAHAHTHTHTHTCVRIMIPNVFPSGYLGCQLVAPVKQKIAMFPGNLELYSLSRLYFNIPLDTHNVCTCVHVQHTHACTQHTHTHTHTRMHACTHVHTHTPAMHHTLCAEQMMSSPINNINCYQLCCYDTQQKVITKLVQRDA